MPTMTDTLPAMPIRQQIAYLEAVAARMGDPLHVHTDEQFLIRHLLRLVGDLAARSHGHATSGHTKRSMAGGASRVEPVTD